jgi:hypothetical protein
MARSGYSNYVEMQTGHRRIQKLDRFLQRPEGQRPRKLRDRHRPRRANHRERSFGERRNGARKGHVRCRDADTNGDSIPLTLTGQRIIQSGS